MHSLRLHGQRKWTLFRRYSSSIRNAEVALVEHDIFALDFVNLKKAVQKTSKKLFIYVNTGPAKIIPIERHERALLLDVVGKLYKKCYELNPELDATVLFDFSKSDSQLIEAYPDIEFYEFFLEPQVVSLKLCPEGVTTPFYDVTCLGGTFDRLHLGHKLLLTAAAVYAKKEVVIGIADHELLAKKSHADMIQPYAQREKAVLDFLNTVNPHLKYLPVPIQDPFGPTITRKEIDAVAVSGETVNGALRINEIRTEKGWNPLEIIQINLIEDESGEKFSSTALREKELRSKE